jgi:hypothetical protein
MKFLLNRVLKPHRRMIRKTSDHRAPHPNKEALKTITWEEALMSWKTKTDFPQFETKPEPQDKYEDGRWDYLPTKAQPQDFHQSESHHQSSQRVEHIEKLVAELRISDREDQPVLSLSSSKSA